MESIRVTVDVPSGDPVRLDKYIAENLGLFTRSQIKSRKVKARLNGSEAKLSRKLESGDVLEITWEEPAPPSFAPEKIELDIIFENEDVIVVNKSRGMVVHPASGNYTGTLIQGLLYHCGHLEDAFPEERIRPGIVHRLDKDTSGVIITAKTPEALESLARQFREKTIEKSYLAITRGLLPSPDGVISKNIARDRRHRKKFRVYRDRGKPAVTRYRILSTYDGYSFVRLSPETGRTHQIRVHMVSVGCPILGDRMYGRKDGVYTDAALMLHAYRLSIKLPGARSRTSFRAPLPRRFKKLLMQLADFKGG